MSALFPVIIRELTSADGDALFHLRQASFSDSKGFRWRDFNCLRWGDADESGVVFGIAAANGELLSSRRTNRFETREACEDFLEVSMHGVPYATPLFPMTRTVTRTDVANTGLHALLTWVQWLLFPRIGQGTVVGATYRAAPFVPMSVRGGFTFHPCLQVWDSDTDVIDPLVAVLSLDKLDQLTAVYAQSAKRYTQGWHADFGEITHALGRLTRSVALPRTRPVVLPVALPRAVPLARPAPAEIHHAVSPPAHAVAHSTGVPPRAL